VTLLGDQSAIFSPCMVDSIISNGPLGTFPDTIDVDAWKEVNLYEPNREKDEESEENDNTPEE